MISNLQDVQKRLVQQYDPDKIILFGSSLEKGGVAGDIDLMIVKETEKRPIDRRAEVEALLADRTVPIDIVVYTAKELLYLYSLGSPFIEEIMEKGRLVYMRKATEDWVREAEEELESARVLYEHDKYKAACYHSQQAVEKGLKAFIIERGDKPARTHDIVELYNAVTRMGFETGLNIEDAVYLNSIYKGRYPTEEGLLPYGDPLRSDADRSIQPATRLLDRLKTQLR
jgi:HEPN domain-containing protein